MLGTWKGWEWETNFHHIHQSKRHYFVDGKAACGIKIPNWARVYTAVGEGICKKCDKIELKAIDHIWENR